MKLKSVVVVPTKNKQDLFSTVETKTNATKLKMKTQLNRYVSRLLKKLVILMKFQFLQSWQPATTLSTKIASNAIPETILYT